MPFIAVVYADGDITSRVLARMGHAARDTCQRCFSSKSLAQSAVAGKLVPDVYLKHQELCSEAVRLVFDFLDAPDDVPCITR